MMSWLRIAVAVASAGGVTACRNHSRVDAAQSPPRTSPAPQVSWQDNAFTTDRLPAVSRSGHLAVVALRENDTGRGFPNLRIEIRDRNDHATRSIEVLNSNEYERLAPAGTATSALTGRIALANRELAQLHADHDLVAMRSLDLLPAETDREPSDPAIAVGNGLSIRWRGDRLDVLQPPNTSPVMSADARPWLAPPHPSCAACAPCENPAFLGAIFHAAQIHVIVAQIRYRGTDACWEPSDQFHVVAW